VFLALLTGNDEQGARSTLEYFDVWRSFHRGAFDDDAIIALRRGRLSGRCEDSGHGRQPERGLRSHDLSSQT
jgi:hypothetical protein